MTPDSLVDAALVTKAAEAMRAESVPTRWDEAYVRRVLAVVGPVLVARGRAEERERIRAGIEALVAEGEYYDADWRDGDTVEAVSVSDALAVVDAGVDS